MIWKRRAPESSKLGWDAMPAAGRWYVSSVIAIGTALVVAFFPLQYPHPLTFAILLACSCLTAAWKVNLPLPLASGSTLSVSHAADMMALLLLTPQQAVIFAVVGAWTQCTVNVRQRYPLYRTVFSMAAAAITMQATGLVFTWLGGTVQPLTFTTFPRVIVGALLTYFILNTGLVAGAIASSTRQSVWTVWHNDFSWSGPNFMVAGAAGAIAAVVLQRGDHWLAILMLAPVYVSYRTYRVFLGRIEDQQRHVKETERLHGEAIEALMQARRAEVALAHEKERLAVTLRSIGDGVITTDLDGTIDSINNVAEAMTGWTSVEAIGKPLADVFQSFEPETRERRQISVDRLRRSADQAGQARGAVLVARNLAERSIDEIAAPLRDDTGQTIGLVVAFRDISAALKMQEERARAGRVASLGLLAGGIAHDFNNILMAVMGNVSMAKMTVSSTSRAAAAMREAEQACVRARQLTWQLLTFSRGGVPVKKITALAGLLRESASQSLQGTSATCQLEVAPDLHAVSADDGQLVQVFSNILINAQEANPQGALIRIQAANVVEGERRFEHALRVEPGPYVRVSITDNGMGIPKENLARIFDPYFSTKQRGSGLGLATSYSIVKNHGGFVSVESQPGSGTTIHVSLPAAAERVAEPPVPEAIVRRSGTKGRVLVMDDEASIRTLAVNMLEFLGHDVEVVSNGTAAVEHYRRALNKGRPFAAVILDLMVPGGIGAREAIERLTEIDPSVNAIVVSGYAQDPVMTEFRDYGFKAVIGKPFTLEELSRTLNSVMVGKEKWTVH